MTKPEHNRTVSLSTEVSLVAAIVTAVAMGGYAVIQYFTMPDHTILGLIVEHSWHVLALGALTYLVLYAVMHKQVVRPVRALFVKCYAITKGDLNPVQIDTRVEEIQAIADGLNMMIARIRETKPGIAHNELVGYAESLRKIVTTPENQLASDSEEILLEIAANIERVAGIPKSGTHATNVAEATREVGNERR